MAQISQRVNPNTPVSKSLGFDPHGVLVDNITAYWLYFPQADQYCPPFTQGWSAPLYLNTSGYGYMQLQTPFGQSNQTNVPANVSQFVNLTWTDQSVGSSAGQSSGDTGISVDPTGSPAIGVSDTHTLSYANYFSPNTNTLITIIPGVAGKRIRLGLVSMQYALVGSPGPVQLALRPSGLAGQVGVTLGISPEKLSDTLILPAELGLLSPVGIDVDAYVVTGYTGVTLYIFASGVYL